jgi:hypothetical protein
LTLSLRRPGRLAAEEPRDAHVPASPEGAAEGASPPAKVHLGFECASLDASNRNTLQAPAETARFSAKALFAAIGSKRRALHAERKA